MDDENAELIEVLQGVVTYDRSAERRRLYDVLKSASLYVPVRRRGRTWEPVAVPRQSPGLTGYWEGTHQAWHYAKRGRNPHVLRT